MARKRKIMKNAEVAITDEVKSDMGCAKEEEESEVKFHKIAWTVEENAKLVQLVNFYGDEPVRWHEVSKMLGGHRSAKRCRERWVEYLNYSLLHCPFTPQEDQLIKAYQAEHGNKWKTISSLMKNRSPTSIKTRWRRLQRDSVRSTTSQKEFGDHMMSIQGSCVQFVTMMPPYFDHHYFPAQHMYQPFMHQHHSEGTAEYWTQQGITPPFEQLSSSLAADWPYYRYNPQLYYCTQTIADTVDDAVCDTSAMSVGSSVNTHQADDRLVEL